MSMNDRKTLMLTGVKEVLAFDEKQMQLLTESGEMNINGENLHVTTLLLEEGRMALEGRVDSISYSDHGALMRRGLRGLFR